LPGLTGRAMVRPMSFARALVLVLPVALAGCADWPDLPDPPGLSDAPAPRIAPLPDLPQASPEATAALEEETRILRARSAGLRARAARIDSEG